MSSGFGLFSPVGGIKLGNAAIGFFGLGSVTRIGANLLSMDNLILREGIDRVYPRFVTTLGSTVLHLWAIKSSVTLGWMLSEWLQMAESVVDKLTKAGAEALMPALPAPVAPATKGIVGRRFEFESGGVMGRKFNYDSGGVMGDKFGYNSGQITPEERETLRKLKAQVEEGGSVSSPSHVTVRVR